MGRILALSVHEFPMTPAPTDTQNCTIWGYNMVIVINIEYFFSNLWVINWGGIESLNIA